MSRQIKPYKRKKGSKKQKNQLNSFNQFTDELIDTYGVASVADLNDLIGISGDYTDNKYGWTNVKAGEVMRVRDGYVIKMPRAVPID